MAHAVGLDALASTQAILANLTAAGYAITPDDRDLATARIYWPLAAYRTALETLPAELRQELHDVWGEPGRHARSAIGVAELPFDWPVEVEALVAVRAE